MFTEENSKLISRLYNAQDRREISDILELMGESGDGIFVYPMLDGYRKYKNSSIGYYFIWHLSRLDDPNLGKRLSELLESYEIQKEHIPMALFFMAERRCFSEIANTMAAMYLDNYTDPGFRKDFEVNSLAIGCILDYLYEADILVNYEKKLREILFDIDINDADKVVVLTFLLECDQAKQIDFMIEHYADKIQNTFLEKHLAKRLLFCQTDNVRKLKKIIITKGQKKSSDLLLKYDCLPKKEGGKSETPVYKNLEIVIKIAIIREQINKKTLSSKQFGFTLFPINDLLVHQGLSIDDKNLFLDMCGELVKIARDVNPCVRNHGLGEKEISKILEKYPKDKWGWDIVHLNLYLHAKNVGVDSDYYGFKNLNEMLDLIIEDKEDEKYFDKMESFGIMDIYRKGQWHKIHNILTNAFLQNIETMNKALSQYIEQDLGE